MSSFGSQLAKKGLKNSTSQKYEDIIAAHQGDPNALVKWLNRLTNGAEPLGTILPARAAIGHYLVSVMGYDAESVKQLLPKAEGRPANMRIPLEPYQLALYHAVVDELKDESIKTLLTLLPQTGLRVSELCGLSVEDVGVNQLVVKGRKVPINSASSRTLQNYQTKSGLLFSGYGNQPLGGHAVRKYTRRIAADNPELIGLCPQVLRSTAIVMWLRDGVKPVVIQQILGHKSVLTTQRYLSLV